MCCLYTCVLWCLPWLFHFRSSLDSPEFFFHVFLHYPFSFLISLLRSVCSVCHLLFFCSSTQFSPELQQHSKCCYWKYFNKFFFWPVCYLYLSSFPNFRYIVNSLSLPAHPWIFVSSSLHGWMRHVLCHVHLISPSCLSALIFFSCCSSQLSSLCRLTVLEFSS